MPSEGGCSLRSSASSVSEDFTGPITRYRSRTTQRRRMRGAESEADISRSASSEYELAPSEDESVSMRLDLSSCDEYQCDSDEDEGNDSSSDSSHEQTLPSADPDQAVDATGTMEHPARFATLQEARGVLDGLENARFAWLNNNSVTRRLYYTSHVECTAEARIKVDADGKFRLFGSGMHTAAIVVNTSQLTGIHKPLLPEIYGLLLGGMDPKKCLTSLQLKYKSTLALLPTLTQLNNRAHRLRKPGDFAITTYAGIMEWAAPRMCLTESTFHQNVRYSVVGAARRFPRQPLDIQNELLVFDCFPNTLDNGDVSVGVIFTSRRLFPTAARSLLGQHEHVLGATDGTYKLHFGGWTLVSFGTVGVHYTAAHKYRQKFYPMAFMFVRTETTFAYARMFSVCKERCDDFLGGTMDLQYGSMDHCAAIASAFREVWPEIKLSDCWPHLERKSREKKALLTDRDHYDDIIKPQLKYLSQARSPNQFEALSKWSRKTGQSWERLNMRNGSKVHILQTLVIFGFTQLVAAPELCRIITRLKRIIAPSRLRQQNHLRAVTGHVLASTLPRILVECAMDIGYDSIRHYTPGPVSVVMLQKSVNLCMDDNHYPTHRRKSQRTIAKIEKYYFNAEYYVVRDDL